MGEDFINYLAKDLRDIKSELVKARLDIQTLKVKSKVWGGITGTIASAIISLITVYLQSKK